MPSALSVIKKYFTTSATTPGPSGIAAAGRLASLWPAFLTSLLALKMVPLSPSERTAMQAKDPPNQLQLARALLKLCRRRPELASAAGLDPDDYDTIIHKDEAFDLLAQTLLQINPIVDGGLLLLEATAARTTTSVLAHARDLLQRSAGPAELLTRVRVLFGAIEVHAQAHKQRRVTKPQRQPGAQP